MVAVQSNDHFVAACIGSLIAGSNGHVTFNTSKSNCLLTAGIGVGAGNSGFCHRLLLYNNGDGLGVAIIVVCAYHGVGDGVSTCIHQISSSLITSHSTEIGGCRGQGHSFAVGDSDCGGV